jgi:predicted nuclease of predicted toxin-antitoxin system
MNQTGLGNPDDIEIWQYAKRENFVIVSHDSDFDDLIIFLLENPSSLT